MADEKRLLIIDDEENMRHFLKALLEKEGYTVSVAADGLDGLNRIEQQDFDIVLCDLRMPGMDGIGFLTEAARRNITSTIITMSAYGTIDLALKTLQMGAYDYVSKPFKPTEIILALKKAEERERLKKENVLLRKEVETKYSFDNLIGKSPQFLAIIDLIKKVSTSKSAVLITGESGTGKEVVARAIHYNSPRKNKTFLAINCGAIPDTLLESELFGHKKGAFTGATRNRKGFFEEADEGTLFLDEIGEIPTHLQVKLLRVLQEGETRRIGEERSTSVDVRIIAATSKNIPNEVAQGTFREDLYYRLNVLPVQIPPLRERSEDITLLVDHFIEKQTRRHGIAVTGITPAARKILLAYSWPGNVRELENIIERCIVLTNKEVIDADVIPEDLKNAPEGGIDRIPDDVYSIKKCSRIMEEKLIRKALQKTHGNKSRAAKILEISYPALLSKIAEYAIEEPDPA